MPKHFDFSAGSWEHDDYLERSESREPRQPTRHLTAADYSERAARILGAAFTRELPTTGEGGES